MPRFVILEHDHPTVHWDLMLEAEGCLRTWRLAQAPAPNSIIAAEQIPDHRQMYLDYEGPVSGQRGTVSRWDAGSFEWLTDTPHDVAVMLNGKRLQARAVLKREAAERWLLMLNPRGIG